MEGNRHEADASRSTSPLTARRSTHPREGVLGGQEAATASHLRSRAEEGRAVKEARQISWKERSELGVHTRDGRSQPGTRHGRDPGSSLG